MLTNGVRESAAEDLPGMLPVVCQCRQCCECWKVADKPSHVGLLLWIRLRHLLRDVRDSQRQLTSCDSSVCLDRTLAHTHTRCVAVIDMYVLQFSGHGESICMSI